MSTELFSAVKNPMQKKSLLALAHAIVTSPTQSVTAPAAKVDKFIAAGASEIVKGAVDPTNAENVVVTLTPAALAIAQGLPAPAPAAPRETGPITFTLGTIEDIPESKRGGNKGDSYPFDQLAAPVAKLDANSQPVVENGIAKMIYSNFFVPATAQRPNPSKSLQSTAASATKRYASSDGRVFVARKATDATGAITGAYVIRTK